MITEIILLLFGVSWITAERSINKDDRKCGRYSSPCRLDDRVKLLETHLYYTVLGTMKPYWENNREGHQAVKFFSSELDQLKRNQRNAKEDQMFTSLMTKLLEELDNWEVVVRLQNEIRQLMNNLEQETKKRLSLEIRVSRVDEELKEIKSWKPIVNTFQGNLENFTSNYNFLLQLDQSVAMISNEISELTTLVGDLQHNASLMNSSLTTRQSELEELVTDIKKNYTLLYKNITQLNIKEEELEMFNETLFASLEAMQEHQPFIQNLIKVPVFLQTEYRNGRKLNQLYLRSYPGQF